MLKSLVIKWALCSSLTTPVDHTRRQQKPALCPSPPARPRRGDRLGLGTASSDLRRPAARRMPPHLDPAVAVPVEGPKPGPQCGHLHGRGYWPAAARFGVIITWQEVWS